MTVLDRQPQAGACDQSKQRMETDGWYIDAPKAVAAQPPSTCHRKRRRLPRRRQGERRRRRDLLGFPIATRRRSPAPTASRSSSMQMEVTEFEVTNLDAALFEIPEGMTAAPTDASSRRRSATRTKRNSRPRAALGAPPPRSRHDSRWCSRARQQDDPEVDTRALRTQLIAELAEQKMEGVPLAAAPQDELNAYAKDLGCDYLLVAQITELKASKPGSIGRLVKSTAGESADKDVTEAKLTCSSSPSAVGSRDSRPTPAETTAVSASRPASASRAPRRCSIFVMRARSAR